MRIVKRTLSSSKLHIKYFGEKKVNTGTTLRSIHGITKFGNT